MEKKGLTEHVALVETIGSDDWKERNVRKKRRPGRWIRAQSESIEERQNAAVQGGRILVTRRFGWLQVERKS